MQHPSSSPPRRFQPVTITPARLDQLHEHIHKALTQTIGEFVRLDGESVNAARWCLLRSRGGLSAFSDRRLRSTHLSSLLVAGTLRARLADVMEGLNMDTSEATRLVHHQLSARFVDAEVLKVIEQRTIERPFAFTGIKWAMLKSSSSGIVSNRDICFFEKLGMIEVANGRRLGYFIMQSIDIPECPPSKSRKVIRADISLCYLFEELQDGVVGVYMRGTMESYGPQMLWKMARKNFADLVVSVSNVERIAHAKRCTRLMLAKHAQVSSRPIRSIVCEVCHSLPAFFDHHQECAGCNKVSVCKKCRVKCHVFDCDRTTRLVPATFCIDCARSARSPTKPIFQAFQRPKAIIPCTPGPIHEPAREDIEHVRLTVPQFDSYDGSRHTLTEDESSDEHVADSQRSLREFSLKLALQLEDVGYSDSDVCLRLTDLASLGAGSTWHTRDGSTERKSQGENHAVAASPTSSCYSVGGDQLDDDHSHELDHDETIISIRPLRRSTQPPEMLARQSINADGTVRLRPHAQSLSALSPPARHAEQAALMSRLVQASIAAEQTARLTREQARRAYDQFAASRGHHRS